jgi:glycosyltransferase involved in cell wall biosynthesis
MSLARDQAVGVYLRDRGIEDIYSSAPKYSLKNVEEICASIRAHKIDIVHLHGYGAAHFGRLAAAKCNVPNIVHEHAILKIKPQHFIIDWLLRNRTDLAIAVSEAVRDFIVKGRSVPSDRVRVIGNGVDLDRFIAKTADSRIRARQLVGIEEDVPVIGTVTRFREEKGNADLIRAFKRVHDRNDATKLVLVGDGELRQSLYELARDLGLESSVIWLGFRSDVEKIMPAFDVQAIPSWTEGYPLALAEAMAVGNALVATEVGGMRELGRNEINVLFVPPRSPAKLGDACMRLLKDRNLAHRISEEATETAKTMSIEISSKKILNVYEELMCP